MKKLLLSFSAVIAASTTIAQVTYDLEAILVTPTEGASVAGTASQTLDFSIKNNGPDALPNGDTLYFSYTIGTSIYDLDGTLNGASGVILPQAVPSGFTFTSAMIGSTATLDLSGITTNTDVCGVAWGLNGPALTQAGDPRETTPANNLSCFTATPPAVSLTEESLVVASVYPNPASDVLNIKSAEVVKSVSVVTMDGKVLLTSTSTSIDISNLSAGTYVYIVSTVSGSTAIGNFTKN